MRRQQAAWDDSAKYVVFYTYVLVGHILQDGIIDPNTRQRKTEEGEQN